MTATVALSVPMATPKEQWGWRVRKVGGFIQLAFAAFWLVRGGLTLGGVAGSLVLAFAFIGFVIVNAYGVRVTAGKGHRPTGAEAKRIEKSVNIATVAELLASVALPFVVIAAGRSDWVLPSIAITIGPLLLWLDHLVDIPRFRYVGWALTVGPIALVIAMTGDALAATTGIAAGLLLLGSSAAGFHDLTGAPKSDDHGTLDVVL
jgi:hypothetical protein